MKKTYKIQIGNKIFFHKVGVFLGIVGSIITGFFALMIFTEITHPTEMTVVFLIEFFEQKIYLALLASLLALTIGIKIIKIRIYKSSKLTIESNKISLLQNGQLIEIPEPRLHKISERKSFLSKKHRIKIKTDTHKEYDIKGYPIILEHLNELFPNKTELKNVAQHRL